MTKESKDPDKRDNKHEKETPDYDKQVPPSKTPDPKEPKPGKRGK